MVLFCVERRKAWRLLQSKAGIANEDYAEQKGLLQKIDSGELTVGGVLASRQEAATEMSEATKPRELRRVPSGVDGGGS